MKVYQVKDRMKVKPDSVYVIPPNKDMSILHGVLHLFPRRSPAACACPSIIFSVPWPRISRSAASV